MDNDRFSQSSATKNGATTSFTYDDEGLRRSKTTGTLKTEYFVYDGTLRGLQRTDGVTMQFVYGNGLSSVIFNGTEYWYVYNVQGDVIGIIDKNGDYVVEYTYDAWGKPLSKTGTLADTLGTLNPFRYRGYIYDEETGFYYVSSRYYDPEIGRWLNSDSVVAGVGEVQGYNLFAYCYNNPIINIDTNGMWVIAINLTAMANFLFGAGVSRGIVFDGANISFYSSTLVVEAIPAASFTVGIYYNSEMSTITEFEGKSAQVGFGVGAIWAGIPLTASVEVDADSSGAQLSFGVGASATPIESHIVASNVTILNKPSIMPDPHPATSADVFRNPYTFNNINTFYTSVSSSNMYVPRVNTGTTYTTSFVASAYTVRM